MGKLRIVAAMVGFGFVPALGGADPVTSIYQIHIAQRCTPAACVPFSSSFLLSLSFDSAVTDATNEPEYLVRRYGIPTFSDIPLERPSFYAGATEFASTADIALVVPPFDWRHVAEAQRGAQLVTADYDYRWYVGLYEAQDFFPSAPELSPSSFAAFLGSGQNPTAFAYSFAGLDRHRAGELSGNSVGYLGTAILQEAPTPVPEPMSLLLVSSGLCGLACRGWRQKRLRRGNGSGAPATAEPTNS